MRQKLLHSSSDVDEMRAGGAARASPRHVHDVFYFFCRFGSVDAAVSIIEIVTHLTIAYPSNVWRFENDQKRMMLISKLDAVKIERLFQKQQGKGSTPPIRGAYGREYVYNFDDEPTMTQMNTKSKRKRKIERESSEERAQRQKQEQHEQHQEERAFAGASNSNSNNNNPKSKATAPSKFGMSSHKTCLTKQEEQLRTLPAFLRALNDEPSNIPVDVLVLLQEQRIDEATLLLLSADDLKEAGVPLGPRLALMKAVTTMKEQQQQQQQQQSNNNAIASPQRDDAMAKLRAAFPRTLVFEPSDIQVFPDARLGSGGQGAVFAATLTGSGRPVAVKIFDDFPGGANEAQRCLTLHHPYILGLLGVSVYTPSFASPSAAFAHGAAGAPRFLMVMELAECSLDALLARRGAGGLAWPVVMRYAIMLANALAFLHARKPAALLHLDLKCHNILLFSNGTVLKICDWGISRATSAAHGMTDVTCAGRCTPAYSAPEQLTSTRVAPTNDVYSFGVVLFYLITARNPSDVLAAKLTSRAALAAEASATLLDALETAAAASSSGRVAAGCPPVLLQMCRMCLSFDPAARPKDGVALLRMFSGDAMPAEFSDLVRGIEITQKTAATAGGAEVGTVAATNVGVTQEFTGVDFTYGGS